MQLINQNNGQIVAESVSIADTFLKRFKGLMLTKKLSFDCALYITPCKGIHTFFMRYSIDVLHLNQDGKVIALEENLKPWRMTKVYSDTTEVVELSSGKIEDCGIKIGHNLKLI